MRPVTKNCGTLLEYYKNVNTNGQCGMQYFLTPLNRIYMSIYVFYFFAVIIGLWAYRLAAYFFGGNPKTSRNSQARSEKRRVARY